MASQFYNRLVGVTILVASIVIFLPSIIDGKKTAYQDEDVAMPIRPLLNEHRSEIQQPQKKSDVTTASDKVTETEINKTEHWQIQNLAPTMAVGETQAQKAIATEEIKPIKKVQVVESAWTIQLGAFQNAKNINLLLKKLNKAGYQVHTVPTDVIDGQLTRLFVGPDISKEKLEKQLPQLKRLTQLQGKLLPFNAVKP